MLATSNHCCSVCGCRVGVAYRPNQLQRLCSACARTTPEKVTLAEFERKYFGNELPTVPRPTVLEFYRDYLTTDMTLADYIADKVGDVADVFCPRCQAIVSDARPGSLLCCPACFTRFTYTPENTRHAQA